MIDIIVSDNALKDSEVRLFPESKHRSQRIRKKLIKRHGGEFKRVPCMFQMGGKIIAHPVLYDQLQKELASRHRDTYENQFMNAYRNRY